MSRSPERSEGEGAGSPGSEMLRGVYPSLREGLSMTMLDLPAAPCLASPCAVALAMADRHEPYVNAYGGGPCGRPAGPCPWTDMPCRAVAAQNDI